MGGYALSTVRRDRIDCAASSPKARVIIPLNNRAHGIAVVALCVAFPLGFGALALVLGQDTNWDLRNYHWYNPYAFLTGRFALDIGPAHAATFYNPLLDVPVYLLAQALPAKAVGFLLGTVQGLNFVLLFALLRALIVAPSPAQRSGFAAVVAGVGMSGGGHLSLVGTTFNDVSLAVIGAALIPRGVGIYDIRRADAVVLRSHRHRRTRPRGRRRPQATHGRLRRRLLCRLPRHRRIAGPPLQPRLRHQAVPVARRESTLPSAVISPWFSLQGSRFYQRC
jgi:hypothetical protein